MPQISINSLLGTNGPSYAEAIVSPYRDELVRTGFEQLFTVADVDQALNRQDNRIALVVLNSVCGCSARVARPGTILSLFNELIPDRLFTLFAGMEKEAVAHFREKYLPGLTPSSPNIAIFKNGQLVQILHRYQIERMSAEEISKQLTEWYNQLGSKNQTPETKEKLRKYFLEKYQADPFYSSTE
jgi:putative YphP/YqiW family bacilliredoxin